MNATFHFNVVKSTAAPAEVVLLEYVWNNADHIPPKGATVDLPGLPYHVIIVGEPHFPAINEVRLEVDFARGKDASGVLWEGAREKLEKYGWTMVTKIL